jgi:hypothetical protein
MQEIWKDIKGYEGCYQVSNYGRVKSLPRKINARWGEGHNIKGRIMSQRLTHNGYLVCSLRNGNIQKTYKVHRLVGEVFVENGKNYPQINHKDGNKLNNKPTNLEWVTPKQNTKHAFDTNLRNPPKGKSHHNARLTEKDVLEIRKNQNGLTHRELSVLYNISSKYISELVTFKKWKHI